MLEKQKRGSARADGEALLGFLALLFLDIGEGFHIRVAPRVAC
jgi:hypothetical protein